MVGIPQVINTKQDWLNTFNHVVAPNANVDLKKQFVSSLKALKNTGSVLVVKAAARNKKPEDQTPEDFESVDDPNSSLIRSGLTIADIDAMIAQLS